MPETDRPGTRVALLDLPRMLRAIVDAVLAPEPDVEVAPPRLALSP